MKVVHIAESIKGGIATYLNTVLQYQSQYSGLSGISVIIPELQVNNLIIPENVNLYTYEYERGGGVSRLIRAMAAISAHINKIRPDIIHIHSSYAGFLARVPLFLGPIPAKIVYCAHGWAFAMEGASIKRIFYSFIERILAWKTSLIINLSEYDYWISLKFGLPAGKSCIIYSGSDEPREIKNVPVNLDPGLINILYAGRFDKQKGLDILLAVFQALKSDKVRLYIIGEPVLNDAALEIPPNTQCLGWIPNDIIDSYYRLFDAVIVPSRWEGLCLVALEAMKNKKPVIASNRSSLPEIIQDGVNGYLFDLDKPDELTSILAGLQKNVLKKMGENGLRLYTDKFGSELMNRKILEQYTMLKR